MTRPQVHSEALERDRTRRNLDACRRWYRKNRIRKCETKALWSWRQSLKRVGWTEEMYDARLKKQGGACALCREPEARGTRLSIDHDHITGVGRGLLCRSCNLIVGLVEANGEKVMSYLKAAKAAR